MSFLKRVVIIILDSAGIGAAPDAEEYGDEKSNTLGNIARYRGYLNIPNLAQMGLNKLIQFEGQKSAVTYPFALFGKMTPRSPGKDTITGHWEIAGIILDEPFPLYPNGFPTKIINEFEILIGRKVLGNIPASGTKIITKLGQKHIQTGFPIIYTSADSVFQIAAHEDIVPVEQLYYWCRIARKIMQGNNAVARIIARPFIGELGNFKRTANRKDFTIPPPGVTMLKLIKETGLPVIGIGKIKDIFAGGGITKSVPTADNSEGIEKTLNALDTVQNGLIFTNLVDFDMLYGHRRDIEGYAIALEEFDKSLPLFINKLKLTDILVITADHGCDPTMPGTDHTREYVPLLIYNPRDKQGKNIGIRSTFADLGATVCEIFNCGPLPTGRSFMSELDLY